MATVEEGRLSFTTEAELAYGQLVSVAGEARRNGVGWVVTLHVSASQEVTAHFDEQPTTRQYIVMRAFPENGHFRGEIVPRDWLDEKSEEIEEATRKLLSR